MNALHPPAVASPSEPKDPRPAGIHMPPWVTAAILAAGGSLIVAAILRGQWLRSHGSFGILVNAPPLTGVYHPLLTQRSVVALGVGALGVWGADRIARRSSWRALLITALAAALLWALALAFWDAAPGFIRAARSSEGYATAIASVGDAPGAFLHGFVEHIRDYSAHVQAHPPGMVMILWVMDRIGIAGPWWESTLQLTAAAASVPAVLLTVREVAGDERARAAAPFLVLTPAAVAWSSGDAVLLGVGSWAVAAIVLASGRRGRRSDFMAIGGGLLGGSALMLSYGLGLLALVPLAVVVARRRWRVLCITAAIVVLVLFVWAAAGFSWPAGFRATRKLYREGISSIRPYTYFVWANLAAFVLVVGPAVWVGLARLRDRKMWLLVGGALAAVALADLSGMSKAEVERIWVPFVPWLVAGAGVVFVSMRERRVWLGAQVACALAVQWLVRSAW